MPAVQSSVAAWAHEVARAPRSVLADPLASLPDPTRAQTAAPTPTRGTGHDRALLDGVTLEQPAKVVPTFMTNVVERLTGTRDERSGAAIGQILLAGQQLVQGALRQASRGDGAIATGTSVLRTVLPVLSIGIGVSQVREGWNELQSHEGGPLSLIGSRAARTGLLQVAAGALLFLPGVGSSLAGAATRLAAAANELDMFAALDRPVHEKPPD